MVIPAGRGGCRSTTPCARVYFDLEGHDSRARAFAPLLYYSPPWSLFIFIPMCVCDEKAGGVDHQCAGGSAATIGM